MADGDYGIRVDHLSDVLFIPEFDVTQAEENAFSWKAKGSEHFNQNDFRSAIQW